MKPRARHVKEFGPPNDPPLADERPAYDLIGARRGRPVFVVCPGWSLDLFPLDELRSTATIAVNAAIEVFDPTWWLFVEPKLIRTYMRWIKDGRIRSVVTHRWNAWMRQWMAGGTVWGYQYVAQIRHRIKGADPWWLWPAANFLPGHCTVTAHAISLSEIMGASKIVLVGADQCVSPANRNYCKGVSLNDGPWWPTGALDAGRDWISAGIRQGLWKTPIVQVEPASALPVETISRERAVEIARADASSS